MSTTDTPPTVNGTARPAPTLTLVKEQPDAVETAAPVQPAPTKKTRRHIRVTRALVAAVKDERTRTGARFTARHVLYVAGGTRIVWRRSWESRSAARYDRMIRTAEAAGQHEGAAEWEEKRRLFVSARHQRRMDLMNAIRTAPRAVGAGVLSGAGVLAVAGIALGVTNHNAADVLLPFKFVLELVSWAFLIGTVVWGTAKLLGPALILAALWNVGRQRLAAPAWALPAQLRGDAEQITPSIVVKAFRDLRIGPLRQAIVDMEDGGASMLSPIAFAGCGVEVDVTLPSSVSTDEIEKKRRKLAENLNRHEHEVFILKSPQPRTVKLWIADSGALDEPIGPSPLVTDLNLVADYKTGRAPIGQSLRGDASPISLFQRMLLMTGLSNQGKTAALRAIALWLAFDTTVTFRIADLKGIGDWSMFEGLAEVLIEGPTDDHVAAATEMLEEGVREMNRRLMAPPGTTWEPLILICDEAQKAFMCPAKGPDGRPYGGTKNTSRYYMAARELHNQGRAVDVLLWQGTQNPTDQNLPSLVREGAHIRASLVVGTESQSKMALGDKAVDGGAAPHLLRQGLDKGTIVFAGDGVELQPGEASITIRTHFIDTDPAHDVAKRAKALRTRVATLSRPKAVEQRDELQDLKTVVGVEDRVRTPEVLHRLKNLAESYYQDWDGGRLKRLLTDSGEGTDLYQGNPVVKRERVQRALDNRESGDPEIG